MELQNYKRLPLKVHVCRVTALKTELFEDGAYVISLFKFPATSMMPGAWQTFNMCL